MDNKPTQDSFALPPSMALGADQQAVSALVGVISIVINRHKLSETESTLFRIADLNIGNGALAGSVVDAFRSHCTDKDTHVVVSGTEIDVNMLEAARAELASRNALGALDVQDASSSPAAALRNKLQCGGGADMVVYAHAAYPNKLPSFKLPRMVDRLGDVAAPHGAVVTLHNHGPSDVEDIRKQVLGLPVFSTAGLNCNTQQRLEQSFNEAKLHSFSVTVPNVVELPANMQAVEAIFHGQEASLSGQDAKDAAHIRMMFEKIAGGKRQFDGALAEMDDADRENAAQYFGKRIREAGGKDLPITVGGGQMVMAFRSASVAQEAFAAINKTCRDMTPPAIALPISREVMPEFDKSTAHAEWKDKLAEHGIKPPRVCQAEQDKGRA